MSHITRILLLVLCLSLHACDGRRPTFLADRKHDKNVKISNQGGRKESPSPTKTEISSSSSALEVHENGSTSNKSKVSEAKPLVMKDSGLVKVKQTTRERSHKSDGLGKTVTWRVPGYEHKEEHPGFNLDYSPANTHPPSHN